MTASVSAKSRSAKAAFPTPTIIRLATGLTRAFSLPPVGRGQEPRILGDVHQ